VRNAERLCFIACRGEHIHRSAAAEGCIVDQTCPVQPDLLQPGVLEGFRTDLLAVPRVDNRHLRHTVKNICLDGSDVLRQDEVWGTEDSGIRKTL